MRVYQFSRHEWAIAHPVYSEALRTAARLTPGMHWNKDRRAWVGFPDAIVTCAKHLEKAKIAVLGLSEVPSPDDTLFLTLPTKTADLRGYQAEGVEFLAAHAQEGVLLSDEMSLGKSAQSIRAARAFRNTTTVVCPPFATHIWQDELGKWWPEAKPYLCTGIKDVESRATDLIDYDVAIIHYGLLKAWAPTLAGWSRTLILDEAQALQSHSSARSKAAKVLARACSARMALSGTPMSARPINLWNLLDTLAPGRFGGFYDFAKRYCEGHNETIPTLERTVFLCDGASNLDELRERLMYMTLRRTKADVALDLPEFQRQVIEVDVEKKFIAGPNIAWTHSDTIKRAALDRAADGKLVHVLEMALEMARGGSRIIIYCHRRAVAEHLAAAIAKADPAIVASFTHGGHSFKERRARIAAAPQVLCVTMDSVETAISLVSYDSAIYAELDWIPKKFLQTEARLHRQGQKKAVSYYYVVARGTIDEIIRDVCLNRLSEFSQLFGEMSGLKDSLAIDPTGWQDRIDQAVMAYTGGTYSSV